MNTVTHMAHTSLYLYFPDVWTGTEVTFKVVFG